MDKRLESFKRLLDIMDELRDKCPWDREQTFDSLRNNTIEEVYELVDAASEGDMDEVKKELGDLLLHVVFYSKIGSEEGYFDIIDVCEAECDKLIYRHPHVFSNAGAENSEEVTKSWEVLKQKEKDRKGGVMSGVPKSLPPVVKAYRIQEKASAIGFDWKNKEEVWKKVQEEVQEIEHEVQNMNLDKMEEEFGDLLFSIVNAARLYGVNSEKALERCNKKFITRFEYIESKAKESGRDIKQLSAEEMEAIWQESKSRKL
ncbi:MAG: nucleoside triphosphate pyrophosphohydrolase [Rikenellaceae bacterium]|nr:nucleoside triphosphate pyrophosphohydrolase [Rikenellaceae bacterium]